MWSGVYNGIIKIATYMVTPWQSLDSLVLGASLWVGVAVTTPLKKSAHIWL